MPQYLSLSKAARLAGVSRTDIQERIKQRGAKTFEGKLTTEILQKLYPDVDLESDPTLDRVEKIKSDARPKRHYGDGWTPQPELLISRLKQFHKVLVANNSILKASETLVEDILGELNSSVNAPAEKLQASVESSITKLEQALLLMRRSSKAAETQIIKHAPSESATYKVRILPSGHEFTVDGNDSLLEAGLKAGFYLDYGCSSHNCGKCVCRIVAGSVVKIKEYDYVLTAKQKEQNTILACCHTADSDLILEAPEVGATEDLPYQEIRAVVKKIRLETEDLARLEIQTPRSQLLRFKAGQKVTLVCEDETAVDLYIASCPCDGRNLQFIVFKHPGSVFSDSVFNRTLSKQSVLLKGPSGDFLLQEESAAAALFLACEKGFAPIKSLLEQAINIDSGRGLQLIQTNCYPPGSPLDHLCLAWNDALDYFLYTAVPDSRNIEHLIELLSASLAGIPDMEVYIAGPSDWLSRLLTLAKTNNLNTVNWRCKAVD